MWSLLRILLVLMEELIDETESMELGESPLPVLLWTNIPCCKVLFSVSNVCLRCGCPSLEQVDTRIHVKMERAEHGVCIVSTFALGVYA